MTSVLNTDASLPYNGSYLNVTVGKNPPPAVEPFHDVYKARLALPPHEYDTRHRKKGRCSQFTTNRYNIGATNGCAQGTMHDTINSRFMHKLCEYQNQDGQKRQKNVRDNDAHRCPKIAPMVNEIVLYQEVKASKVKLCDIRGKYQAVVSSPLNEDQLSRFCFTGYDWTSRKTILVQRVAGFYIIQRISGYQKPFKLIFLSEPNFALYIFRVATLGVPYTIGVKRTCTVFAGYDLIAPVPCDYRALPWCQISIFGVGEAQRRHPSQWVQKPIMEWMYDKENQTAIQEHAGVY
ncbi:hypothetical protein CLF_105678 [Clonorchis sinensis]|uniref:Uncharacterized protein n=1 Tax=Clonorchis sinensis TaxID=79923 RepID=G7YDZ0_CLOSI|nr:hypothetical protein CLF_105678 [Clonorchis sinensis]